MSFEIWTNWNKNIQICSEIVLKPTITGGNSLLVQEKESAGQY